MGLAGEFQQLHLIQHDPQEQEMLWQRSILREVLGDGAPGVTPIQWLAWGRPGPERPTLRCQAMPVPQALPDGYIGRKGVHLSPQPELGACPREQPAEFHSRLPSQFGWFGTAAVGEQIQGRWLRPATKHQGAHAGSAIEVRFVP